MGRCLVGVVAEGDVVEDYVLFLGSLRGIGLDGKAIGTGHDAFDSVGRRVGLAHVQEEAVENQDSHENHLEVRQEGKDDSGLGHALVDPVGAEEHHQRKTDVHGQADYRSGQGHNDAGLDFGAAHGLVGFGETLLLVGLFRECLDHTDAGDVLTHDAHHIVELGLDYVVERDAFPGDDYDCNQENRSQSYQD